MKILQHFFLKLCVIAVPTLQEAERPQCDIAVTGLEHEVLALSKERIQGR